MDALIKKRGTIKAQITRMETFRQSIQDKTAVTTASELQDRGELLNQYWNQLLETQFQIEALITGDVTEEQTAFGELEKRYLTLKNFFRTNSSNTRPSPIEPTPNGVFAALPKLDLPIFGGSLSDWTSFCDLFRVTIDQNPILQDVQKLQYLKSYLRGEALRTIQSFQISGENYQPAWKLLESRYANKRLIIQTHLKAIASAPYITTESPSKLQNLLTTVLDNARALTALKADTWENLLVFLTVERLDPDTRREWEMALETTEFPSLEMLQKFLTSRSNALQTAGGVHKPPTHKAKENPQRSSSSYPSLATASAPTASRQSAASKCICCEQPHRIYGCERFAGWSIAQRSNFVSTRQMCQNCLSARHRTDECISAVSCRKCGQKHHTLLHDNIHSRSANPNNSGPSNRPLDPAARTFSMFCRVPTLSILPTAQLIAGPFSSNGQRARAFLDTGSQTNFISESLVRLLRLRRRSCNLEVTGISGDSPVRARGQVDLDIHSIDGGYRRRITAVILQQVTNQLPPVRIHLAKPLPLPRAELSDPSFDIPGPVDLLLGTQVCLECFSGDVRQMEGGPAVVQTALGPVVAGEYQASRPEHTAHSFLIQGDALDQQLQRFWTIEDGPEVSSRTPDETRCEDHFLQTTTRDVSGRYTVSLPFRDNQPALGRSRPAATTRFLQLERKLHQDPETLASYSDFMRDYISLGHMVPVADETGGGPDYYLPHRAVIKTSSQTTKLRVVFDASAPTSTGQSLNDLLSPGPALQASLPAILMNFRFHYIPLIADIEKMFRQILITKEQRRFQRIVWREHPSHPLQDFELTTVTYGTSSAPYLAIRTLQQLAQDEAGQFPAATAVLRDDFYVDDCLSGATTAEEAAELKNQLTLLLARGGFNLRQWSSTQRELWDRAVEYEPNIKTLGVAWNADSDSFSYTVSYIEPAVLTKRFLLSTIAKIYDPIGLITPIVLIAKTLLQSLWLKGKSWDDPVDDATRERWNSFISDLQHVNDLQIQRRVGDRSLTQETVLHGFSDASETAYGAVIYLVQTQPGGLTTSTLLCARSKVAPLKTVSLPRLELCAAVMLARLMTEVRGSKRLSDARYHLWTDSTVTLAWVTSPPSRWKTFVRNRVSEVQTLTSPTSWDHVPGSQNPADLASRGSTVSAMLHLDLWWKGPDWLISRGRPPTTTHIPDTTSEQRTVVVSAPAVVTDAALRLTDHSSWTRLVRLVAWLLRPLWRFRKKFNSDTLCLAPGELILAERALVRIVQRESFTGELRDLQSGTKLSPKSKLLPFTPFLDTEGLIRIRGRLARSDLPYETRHPVILPSNHHVTSLLTFEQLATILCEIEACLNSRPLCPLDDDPGSIDALTPGHFLIGHSLMAPPQSTVTDTAPHLLSFWQLTRQKSQHFWGRWSREYLVQLQRRSKWRQPSPDVALNDLVVIRDERTPPASWHLGRVIRLHPGPDGKIRSVDVRTATAELTRPISALSLLPRDDSS